MPLTAVVTPAPRRLLTTPDRVRAALGLSAEHDDAQLENRIRAASAAIEAHCGRVFARERVRETHRTAGLRRMALSRTPVMELHSLTVGDVTRLHFLTDPSAGLLEITAGHEDMWLQLGMPRMYDSEPRLSPLVVEYTGGYIVPGWTEDPDTGLPPESTLPLPIEEAVFETVRASLDYATPSSDIQSERLGDYQVTYRDTSRGSPTMPADVLAMLTPYRTLVI